MAKRPAFGGGEEGTVALEFALLSPFFLLLIFGVMIFTLYFATFVAVVQASAEGARASIAGMSDTERGQYAKTRAQAILDGYSPLLSGSEATVTTAAGSTSGTYAVTVSYPLTRFQLGPFYALEKLATGAASTAPTSISHSETVANGGY